jgi:serine/threonine-protein kinase HipA
METLAKEIIETSISVPGVQPKLSLGFIKETLANGTKGRLTVLEALGGQYILKPQNSTFPEMPENEHLTMKLAELLGINDNTLYNWVGTYKRKHNINDVATSKEPLSEQEELKKLA